MHEKLQSAVFISGLVTFIAAYHYYRIFNSWTAAYEFSTTSVDPMLTGRPFNDAYRYMDWILTVPLLLIEILAVKNLSDVVFMKKARQLAVVSALMIASGYYGELFVVGDLTPRWICFGVSMCFFMYIMGILDALYHVVEGDTSPSTKNKVGAALLVTMISWCTYPVVYLFPMFHISGANAVVGIQVGYCVADVISKCVVGLIIYQVSKEKSAVLLGKGCPEVRTDLEAIVHGVGPKSV